MFNCVLEPLCWFGRVLCRHILAGLLEICSEKTQTAQWPMCSLIQPEMIKNRCTYLSLSLPGRDPVKQNKKKRKDMNKHHQNYFCQNVMINKIISNKSKIRRCNWIKIVEEMFLQSLKRISKTYSYLVDRGRKERGWTVWKGTKHRDLNVNGTIPFKQRLWKSIKGILWGFKSFAPVHREFRGPNID